MSILSRFSLISRRGSKERRVSTFHCFTSIAHAMFAAARHHIILTFILLFAGVYISCAISGVFNTLRTSLSTIDSLSGTSSRSDLREIRLSRAISGLFTALHASEVEDPPLNLGQRPHPQPKTEKRVSPSSTMSARKNDGSSSSYTFDKSLRNLKALFSIYDAAVNGFYEVDLPDSSEKLRFIYVPDGEFQFGYSDAERRRLVEVFSKFDLGAAPFAGHNAQPCVRIRVTRGFFILDREVTKKQLAVFTATSPSKGSPNSSPENSQKNLGSTTDRSQDDTPAVDITWRDAQRFCQWLQSITGFVVRLPTEIEWEYAARGPWPQPFPWQGEQFHAWAEKNDADSAPRALDHDDVFDVSWRKIFDMSGNVSEWCLDKYRNDLHRQLLQSCGPDNVYHYNPESNPWVEFAMRVDRDDPSPSRTYRGGSYKDHRGQCEVCTRRSLAESESSPSIGFRPVLLLKLHEGPESGRP